MFCMGWRVWGLRGPPQRRLGLTCKCGFMISAHASRHTGRVHVKSQDQVLQTPD